MNLESILKKRITAKWWSESLIEENKTKYIFDCIHKSPSKNGKYNYEVIVSKSQEFKEWLYYENTFCLDTVRAAKGTGNKRYNGQVLAPMVLTWIAFDSNRESHADCMVSATIAMLAAEEVGLQTGFCSCIDYQKVANKLDRPNKTACVILGIGYIDKIDNDKIRQVYKKDEHLGFDIANVNPYLSTPARLSKPKIYNLIKFYK